MRFVVPKIERETTVVGPLTLKQFLFVGIPGGITLLLWLFWGSKNFGKFLLIALPLNAIGVALAFIQVEGRPLPTFISDAIKHHLSPKMYLWKRQETTVVKTFETQLKFEQKRPPFAPRKESQIAKMKSQKGLF